MCPKWPAQSVSFRLARCVRTCVRVCEWGNSQSNAVESGAPQGDKDASVLCTHLQVAQVEVLSDTPSRGSRGELGAGVRCVTYVCV